LETLKLEWQLLKRKRRLKGRSKELHSSKVNLYNRLTLIDLMNEISGRAVDETMKEKRKNSDTVFDLKLTLRYKRPTPKIVFRARRRPIIVEDSCSI